MHDMPQKIMSEWVSMAHRRPTADDWGKCGLILLWDVNNGCRIGRKSRPGDVYREPVTHWQPMPLDWIPIDIMTPTAADADPWNCVLTLDKIDGPKIIGWNNPIINRRYINGWQRLPGKPR